MTVGRIDDGPDGNGPGDNGGGPPPAIDSIAPDRGHPGTTVVILGDEFRLRATSSRIDVGELGRAVSATILSWTDDQVEAVIPTIEAIGTAGLMFVTLTTQFDQSTEIAFTVLDTTPPHISGLNRSVGLPGDEVRIFGERFGTAGTEGSVVTFDVPGSPNVSVPIVSWSPREIHVRVPDLSAVAGPGARDIRVGTLWGTSNPFPFTVAEPPTVVSVTPGLAPPDAELTIKGRGFREHAPGVSKAIFRFTDEDPPFTTFEAPMEVRSWTPTTIVAILPGLWLLKTSGEKKFTIDTPLGASSEWPVRIGDVGSITSWTRLEPHARTEDLDAGLAAGLRAELADPLWLLGRQWATGQLFGEDAGSVVAARLAGEHAPLDRWRPGRSGPAENLPPGTPLETLVERERVFPERVSPPVPFADRRLAAEAGLHYLRALAVHVEAARAATYRKGYVDEYAIEAPSEQDRMTLDAETVRFLTVMAGRAPDGARLYGDLQIALPPDRGGRSELPENPPIPERDREAVLAAVADWFTWCDSLVSEPPAKQTTWDPERREYAFAVAATLSNREVVLEAPEYFEGRLDWSAFVRSGERLEPERTGEPASTTFTRAVVPSPVSYPGMPAPRLFEFENARVDFGSIDAGPTEVIRLLFVEFATVFGNDWFAIPVDRIPAGSLVRITSLEVTDVFGVQTTIEPFREAPEGGGAWRMFDFTSTDESDARDLLLLPATVASSVESNPLEEIGLVRDELANMGWAIERVVASAGGRPLRRHEQYAEALNGAEAGASAAPPESPALAYRLMTPPPDYWIPLVPRDDPAAPGRRMARAAMRRPRPDGGFDPILPTGRVLEPERPSLNIHDEEIPRDGVRVTRSWQLARNAAGETFLWLGRRKLAGTGEASSVLRFDVVEPIASPPD